jgi:hypothetical protein
VIKREFRNGAMIDGQQRSLQNLLWHPDNGVVLCEGCHAAHEFASERIRARMIPMSAYEFAISLGLESRVGPTIYPR